MGKLDAPALVGRLRPRLGALPVIDRPEESLGHGAGSTPEFARRFGPCLARRASRSTRRRPRRTNPPCSPARRATARRLKAPPPRTIIRCGLAQGRPMSEAAPTRMTTEVFLARHLDQDARHGPADGRPVAMTGARRKHGRIVADAPLRLGARPDGGPCRPFAADIAVMTCPAGVRRPDSGVDRGPFDPEATAATEPRVMPESSSRSLRSLDRVGEPNRDEVFAAMKHIVSVDPEVVVWPRAPDRSRRPETWRGSDAAPVLPVVGAEACAADSYAGPARSRTTRHDAARHDATSRPRASRAFACVRKLL